MKKIRWNLAITVLLLAVTTIISFCFFHFGNKYTANITVLYTLALILIALKTSGYIYGIIASIFCVFAVNYFFSYPYFRLNFTLDGYPVTFAGMLTIALITGAVTTSLKQQQQAISEREKQLAEADKEKLRANLLRAVSMTSGHLLPALSVPPTPTLRTGKSFPKPNVQSWFPISGRIQNGF